MSDQGENYGSGGKYTLKPDQPENMSSEAEAPRPAHHRPPPPPPLPRTTGTNEGREKTGDGNALDVPKAEDQRKPSGALDPNPENPSSETSVAPSVKCDEPRPPHYRPPPPPPFPRTAGTDEGREDASDITKAEDHRKPSGALDPHPEESSETSGAPPVMCDAPRPPPPPPPFPGTARTNEDGGKADVDAVDPPKFKSSEEPCASETSDPHSGNTSFASESSETCGAASEKECEAPRSGGNDSVEPDQREQLSEMSPEAEAPRPPHHRPPPPPPFPGTARTNEDGENADVDPPKAEEHPFKSSEEPCALETSEPYSGNTSSASESSETSEAALEKECDAPRSGGKDSAESDQPDSEISPDAEAPRPPHHRPPPPPPFPGTARANEDSQKADVDAVDTPTAEEHPLKSPEEPCAIETSDSHSGNTSSASESSETSGAALVKECDAPRSGGKDSVEPDQPDSEISPDAEAPRPPHHRPPPPPPFPGTARANVDGEKADVDAVDPTAEEHQFKSPEEPCALETSEPYSGNNYSASESSETSEAASEEECDAPRSGGKDTTEMDQPEQLSEMSPEAEAPRPPHHRPPPPPPPFPGTARTNEDGEKADVDAVDPPNAEKHQFKSPEEPCAMDTSDSHSGNTSSASESSETSEAPSEKECEPPRSGDKDSAEPDQPKQLSEIPPEAEVPRPHHRPPPPPPPFRRTARSNGDGEKADVDAVDPPKAEEHPFESSEEPCALETSEPYSGSPSSASESSETSDAASEECEAPRSGGKETVETDQLEQLPEMSPEAEAPRPTHNRPPPPPPFPGTARANVDGEKADVDAVDPPKAEEHPFKSSEEPCALETFEPYSGNPSSASESFEASGDASVKECEAPRDITTRRPPNAPPLPPNQGFLPRNDEDCETADVDAVDPPKAEEQPFKSSAEPCVMETPDPHSEIHYSASESSKTARSASVKKCDAPRARPPNPPPPPPYVSTAGASASAGEKLSWAEIVKMKRSSMKQHSENQLNEGDESILQPIPDKIPEGPSSQTPNNTPEEPSQVPESKPEETYKRSASQDIPDSANSFFNLPRVLIVNTSDGRTFHVHSGADGIFSLATLDNVEIPEDAHLELVDIPDVATTCDLISRDPSTLDEKERAQVSYLKNIAENNVTFTFLNDSNNQQAVSAERPEQGSPPPPYRERENATFVSHTEESKRNMSSSGKDLRHSNEDSDEETSMKTCIGWSTSETDDEDFAEETPKCSDAGKFIPESGRETPLPFRPSISKDAIFDEESTHDEDIVHDEEAEQQLLMKAMEYYAKLDNKLDSDLEDIPEVDEPEERAEEPQVDEERKALVDALAKAFARVIILARANRDTSSSDEAEPSASSSKQNYSSDKKCDEEPSAKKQDDGHDKEKPDEKATVEASDINEVTAVSHEGNSPSGKDDKEPSVEGKVDKEAQDNPKSNGATMPKPDEAQPILAEATAPGKEAEEKMAHGEQAEENPLPASEVMNPSASATEEPPFEAPSTIPAGAHYLGESFGQGNEKHAAENPLPGGEERDPFVRALIQKMSDVVAERATIITCSDDAEPVSAPGTSELTHTSDNLEEAVGEEGYEMNFGYIPGEFTPLDVLATVASAELKVEEEPQETTQNGEEKTAIVEAFVMPSAQNPERVTIVTSEEEESIPAEESPTNGEKKADEEPPLEAEGEENLSSLEILATMALMRNPSPGKQENGESSLKSANEKKSSDEDVFAKVEPDASSSSSGPSTSKAGPSASRAGPSSSKSGSFRRPAAFDDDDDDYYYVEELPKSCLGDELSSDLKHAWNILIRHKLNGTGLPVSFHNHAFHEWAEHFFYEALVFDANNLDYAVELDAGDFHTFIDLNENSDESDDDE